MECHGIRIRDFRNIADADVDFSSGVNLLVGDNAQGKTNLLEAVHLCSVGKSFRTSHDEELIRFGAEMAEIGLEFSDSVRRQQMTVRLSAGQRKHVELNRVRVTKLSDMVGAFRTVLFCPEHLSLVKSGPGERREFLDMALSQLYPLYLKSLQRYTQVLKQRNKLLRDAEKDRKLFADTNEFWAAQLAHEAAIIARYRYRYLEQLRPHMEACFAEMTGEREKPAAVYAGSSRQDPESYEKLEETEAVYLKKLTDPQNSDREIAAGTTLWGIHKDDVELTLNQRPARAYGSQGQQRSMALALKLAEGEVCAAVCGEKPVFLFDDVFSELDTARRNYLSNRMRDRQVILTTCERVGGTDGKLIHVENGTYTTK